MSEPKALAKGVFLFADASGSDELLDEPRIGPIDMVLHIAVPAEQHHESELPRARDTDPNRQGLISSGQLLGRPQIDRLAVHEDPDDNAALLSGALVESHPCFEPLIAAAQVEREPALAVHA